MTNERRRQILEQLITTTREKRERECISNPAMIAPAVMPETWDLIVAELEAQWSRHQISPEVIQLAREVLVAAGTIDAETFVHTNVRILASKIRSICLALLEMSWPDKECPRCGLTREEWSEWLSLNGDYSFGELSEMSEEREACAASDASVIDVAKSVLDSLGEKGTALRGPIYPDDIRLLANAVIDWTTQDSVKKVVREMGKTVAMADALVEKTMAERDAAMKIAEDFAIKVSGFIDELLSEASSAISTTDTIGAERAHRQYQWKRSVARRLEQWMTGCGLADLINVDGAASEGKR